MPDKIPTPAVESDCSSQPEGGAERQDAAKQIAVASSAFKPVCNLVVMLTRITPVGTTENIICDLEGHETARDIYEWARSRSRGCILSAVQIEQKDEMPKTQPDSLDKNPTTPA